MTKLNLPWCVLLSFSMSYFGLSIRGQILSGNKAVTMSSTFSDWDGNRAVDGNYDTMAEDCQCCAATEYEINPWLEVDLGDTYTVTRILVYSRSDQLLDKQNITGLTIHTDDGQQFQPPSNQWYKYDTFFNFAFTSPVSTRTVNLTVRGERHLIICEVDVIYDQIISRNKKVSMDSQWYNWVGSRAVDGDLRTDATPCFCCAATARTQSPWLRVDLGAEYIINYVVIYGRTDGTYCAESFEGMSIEFDSQEVRTIPAANESKNTAKFYEFRSETTDSVSVVTLRLSHEVIDDCKTMIVVCELVIYGVCGDGTYGHNCGKTCGNCRDGNICNKQTGECTQCEYGYIETNLLCTDLCPSGTHGYNCTEVCGQCRDKTSCNQTNGQCEQCADGYTETNLLCTEVCPNSTYGRNCSEVCGQCRNNANCNKTDGMCDQCQDGYTETNLMCTELCPDGTHGENCTEMCGNCINETSCNQTDGACIFCDDGYTSLDILCKTHCQNGTYGQNCSEVCGTCRNGAVCNKKNGVCDQCERGFLETDLLCKSECPDGRYGLNCSEICGNCVNNIACRKDDGKCGDCENGYYLTDGLCKDVCQDGWYGKNCSQRCGNCVNDETCSKTHGSCSACELGYDSNDKTCKTACDVGFYGDCTFLCGQCRSQDVCNKQTGRCPNGCNPGYWGNNCTTVCPDGKFGENCIRCCGMCKDGDVCDKSTGDCPNGCIDGYQGNQCMSEVTGEGQFCVTIPVLVGSIFTAVIVIAILSVLAVFCFLRGGKTRSPDEISAKPAGYSNYDSLDLSSLQTNVTYINTVSNLN